MQARSIDEEEIARRAYALWEEEGRPEGRHEEHWSRAQNELGTIAPQETPDELSTSAPHVSNGSGTITPPQAADELGVMGAASTEARSDYPAAAAPRKTPRREASVDASEAAAPKRGTRRKSPPAAV